MNITQSMAQMEWQDIANRADSLRRSSEYEPSIPLYHRVLKMIPKSQKDDLNSNHIRIGLSYFMLGKNKKARYHFEYVLEQTNEDSINIYRGHALNNLGLLYDNLGLFKKSLDHYNQALALFERLNNPYQIDLALMNIGIVHKKRGQYKKSLLLLTESSRGFIRRGDSMQMGEIYSSMAGIQDILGNESKAKEFYRKSIHIRKSTQDKHALAISYNNIGIIYMNESKLDSALNYYHLAQYFMDQTSNRNIGLVYHNLGLLYMKSQDSKRASDYFQKAYDHKKSISDTSGIVITLNKRVELELLNNQFSLAREYLLQTKKLLYRSENRRNLKDHYDQWKEYFKQIGAVDSALFYLEKSNVLSQEITKEDYQKELALLQETFEANKRDNDIHQLNESNSLQKNELNKAGALNLYKNWIIVISVIILAVLMVILYVRKQQTTKRELRAKISGVEIEKNRLSQELHDLTGTEIRSLKSDIYQKLRNENFDQNFLHSIHERIQGLSSSIITISHELKLPNFSNHTFSVIIRDVVYDWNEFKPYKCRIEFDDISEIDGIPETITKHIYRFILESLTNVDKHAEASIIDIITKREGGSLFFLVVDNGKSNENTNPGIGHRNLKERANQVNGSFSFSSNNTGNTSSFSIPLK